MAKRKRICIKKPFWLYVIDKGKQPRKVYVYDAQGQKVPATFETLEDAETAGRVLASLRTDCCYDGWIVCQSFPASIFSDV